MGGVGCRLDQAKIKLTSVPAELKLELELSLAILTRKYYSGWLVGKYYSGWLDGEALELRLSLAKEVYY